MYCTDVLLAVQVLDFRACRLTASGLTRLATLPALTSLSCHGLDTCLDAATASCFATSRTLQQLHLGCDYEVPEAALEQLRSVAGGLSMCFRWGGGGDCFAYSSEDMLREADCQRGTSELAAQCGRGAVYVLQVGRGGRVTRSTVSVCHVVWAG